MNYYQYNHLDSLLKQQIMVSQLKNKYCKEDDSVIRIYDLYNYTNSFQLKNDFQPKNKKLILNVLMEMEINSEFLNKTLAMNNLIRKKIKSDYKMDPLNIFGINFDFKLINELVAISLSGILIGVLKLILEKFKNK